MKLELLQERQDWKAVFETSGSLLRRARTTDASSQYSEARLSDWIVWNAYIRSAKEVNVLESVSFTLDQARSNNMIRLNSQVTAEVQAHLDPTCKIDKSWKRNASLALVKLAFEGPDSSPPLDDDEVPYRVSTILRYLQDYGNASTAYNDLRPFVGQLDQDERKQLRAVLDQKAASRTVSHAVAVCNIKLNTLQK